MGFLDNVLSKVNDLNTHPTDVWQVCPHCGKKVHVTSCKLPMANRKEATHYEQYENASKKIAKTAFKLNDGGMFSGLLGEYLGPKAQRGIEEAIHVTKENFKNSARRETTCPNCGRNFVYQSSAFTW